MKRFYMARIDHAIDPTEDTDFALKLVMKSISRENRPKKFSPGPDNVLVAHMNEFEKQCGLVEKYFGVRAQDLTLFQFLSRLEQIKEDIKTQSSQIDKSGFQLRG